MYTLLTIIGVMLVASIANVFCGGRPVIHSAMDAIERLCSRGYTAFFGWPLVFVAAAYALATIPGIYFGFTEAWVDLGTACGIIFLMGLVICWATFIADATALTAGLFTGKEHRQTRNPSVVFGATFLFGVYGSLGLVVLKLSGAH